MGQSFNVILGVFEPGIQGARLIFVEYFSKFYSGNGKPFRPFGAERTHTLPPFLRRVWAPRRTRDLSSAVRRARRRRSAGRPRARRQRRGVMRSGVSFSGGSP